VARELLQAEVAVLKAAGASRDRDLISSQKVWQEVHVPPHLKTDQWFNTDFCIELDNWDRRELPSATGVPIRPNTLGADFFVMLTPSGIPTMMELLEGESIRKSSFREEIRRVECFVFKFTSVLPSSLPVNDAPYLRVARLPTCVAFWVSTSTDIVPLLNAPSVAVDAGCNLLSYRATGESILLDGVLYDT
jgi:hypothetical protein